MVDSIFVETAQRLIREFGLSSRFINILAEERGMQNLAGVLGEFLAPTEKLELMLRIEGGEFFAGSKQSTKDLRRKIIERWDEETKDKSFVRRCNTTGKSDAHKARKLSEVIWKKGGNWPKEFMENSGIDSFFAGRKTNNVSYQDYEDVEPYIRLPQLKDYQIELKAELKKALEEHGDDAKSLISLPTGAGKTRIAVEAYTEFLRPRFFDGKYLIWIAQSEELCEQAIVTFQQNWQNLEFTESLRIYRFYGNHTLKTDYMQGGIVVCSINKLYNALKEKDNDAVRLLIENCGACIIDEAHRAVTMMYETFYGYSQQIRGEKMFPICGLTATPGRTDDITKLTDFFIFRLITPSLPSRYADKPVEYFRDKNYLARPIHKIITTDVTYTINMNDDNAGKLLEELQELMDKAGCKELAKSDKRNRKILEALLRLCKEQTIVYACTVEHARLLEAALIVKGVKAAAITANTPRSKRLFYIEKFREGEIQILINHSVLTTGFDAPKTNNIVICRPIFSDILYEQIVGRGLRGAAFGGTKTCNIIDFTDNLGRFGDQQSYHRFEDFWDKPTEKE